MNVNNEWSHSILMPTRGWLHPPLCENKNLNKSSVQRIKIFQFHVLLSPTCCPTGVLTSVSRSICSFTCASPCCSLSANISCYAWHPISLQRTLDPGVTCDSRFRSGFLRKSTHSADSFGHMITWTNTPLWISHQPLQLLAHFPHFHWRLTCCSSFWQIRTTVHRFIWDITWSGPTHAEAPESGPLPCCS